MLFVKSEELKEGVRLAKPIYNKNGVMLYERNSKLTEQGITSVKNFDIIGIYILEPAEPLSPMNQEDIDFERFQTVSIFSLKDELNSILKGKENKGIINLAENIINKYGTLTRRSTFIQNLRCKDDYTYKHSLNTAILCALIASKMDLTATEKSDVVMAALLHDIGKLLVPQEILNKGQSLTEEEKQKVFKCELEGFSLLKNIPNLSPGVNAIIMTTHREKSNAEYVGRTTKATIIGTNILKVASEFDKLTAMSVERGPSSEIAAIKYMMSENDEYDEGIVNALLNSIKILVAGTTIELTNGKKGIVLVENNEDVLWPVVLEFESNRVYHLADANVHKRFEIKDIMKTMDNRYVIDKETVKKYFNL